MHGNRLPAGAPQHNWHIKQSCCERLVLQLCGDGNRVPELSQRIICHPTASSEVSADDSSGRAWAQFRDRFDAGL